MLLWLTAIGLLSGQAATGQVGVDQIGSGDRVVDTSQLAPIRREVPAAPPPVRGETAQVTSGKRNADAPDSGSTRAQGRNVRAEAVEGDDRCDPQHPQKGENCDGVIETRSAEFQAPDTQPLSPEQRLLLAQKTEEAARDVNSATRRLANGEVDDTNIGLAASTVGALQPPKPEDKLDEVQAQQNAIVSTVMGLMK